MKSVKSALSPYAIQVVFHEALWRRAGSYLIRPVANKVGSVRTNVYHRGRYLILRWDQ